ncbi:MAG TPA: hypothetical protein PLB26_06785 [Rubrivivax sp.]|nr:hypothetical protein [Rubrivivax sp.]
MAYAEIVRAAVILADRSALTHIAAYSASEYLDGTTWRDTRPMTDLREHSPAFTDLARLSVDYARLRGLLQPHPRHAYLVRFACPTPSLETLR